VQRLRERGKTGKGRMVDGRACGVVGVRVGRRLATVWARVSSQNENRWSGWSAGCRFTNHNYK
jgi:aconitase B